MKLSVCAFRLAKGWKAGAEVRLWHHSLFHGMSFKSPFNCVQVSNWLIQYWWMHSVCLSGAFNCNLFGKVSHSFSYVLLVALDVFQRKWKNSPFLKFNLLPKKAWRLNANGENHAFGLLHIACGKNSNTAVQFFKSSRAILKKPLHLQRIHHWVTPLLVLKYSFSLLPPSMWCPVCLCFITMFFNPFKACPIVTMLA